VGVFGGSGEGDSGCGVEEDSGGEGEEGFGDFARDGFVRSDGAEIFGGFAG